MDNTIQEPEFRLYYDEKGNVLFYSCEKPEGNFIVIDALTYAMGRPEVKVIGGRIVNPRYVTVVTKLIPDSEGTVTCSNEDLSVIAEGDDTQKWKLEINEF